VKTRHELYRQAKTSYTFVATGRFLVVIGMVLFAAFLESAVLRGFLVGVGVLKFWILSIVCEALMKDMDTFGDL